MGDEGIRLAAIERVVQGGGQVSSWGVQFLLDRLRATEAERDTIQHRTEEREARRYHAAIGNWKNIAQTAEARAAEAEAVISEAPHGDPCLFWETPAATDADCDCWKSFVLRSDWLARVKREAAQEATDREARRYKAAIDNWKAIAADAETKIGDAWWEGVTAQWQHRPMGNRVLETDNPYREQEI